LPGWLQEHYTVWIAHLTSSVRHTPSIQSNANCLREQVAKVYEESGNQKIIIVAHSMGGLVTRACLGMNECRDKVEAVYTLGTPHAGLNMGIVGKILIKLAEGYDNDSFILQP
jgi:triacylglycerol esterase/lipase EstA (alpha/beta hydrolase family)